MAVVGKLYGVPGSTCTRRVLVTAKELGIELELVNIDLSKGEHKSPAFLEKQPFGQIPVFEDNDGTLLFESRAIARHLATKYRSNKPSLYPAELKDFGLVEQWISVEVSNFDPSISGLVVEYVFKPMYWNAQADPEKVKAHREKVTPILDVYEKHLSTHKYLCGDRLTVADLFHLPYGHYCYENSPNKDLFDTRPHLKAWLNGLLNLQSWKAVSQ